MSGASGLLAGRYRLERVVGSGGVATVHLATDERLGRQVAVKILRSDLADSIMADRFLQETEITARLSHPGIVPLFDTGRDGETIYFVMPFEEGESLRERLVHERQLPVGEAVRIAREVAEALAYAHDHGVIHRDIKPSNLLLSGGHPLVADFGIAKALTASVRPNVLTSASVVIGTPTYMAPEQSMGEVALDGRVDVYALGCVLYEMLAGEPPFQATTRLALAAKHLTGAPPSVRVVRPTAPPGVDEALRTALAKNPADRFPTAKAFGQALGAAMNATTGSEPVPTDPSSYATAGPGPRKPTASLFKAGAVAALAALGGWALWQFAGPSGPALDPNTIMIVPLEGGELGIQTSVALTSALVHVEPLRFRDAWSFLTPEQKADISTTSRSALREMVRDQGAARYIWGRVVPMEDTLTVTLDLWDVEGDSIVQTEVARGERVASVPGRVGLQAMLQLLRAVVPTVSTTELEHVMDREPRAVALWMQGEAEYRQAAFGLALDLLEEAVASDSLLALAALKGAQAAGWNHEADRGVELAQVALRNEGRLPLRHRALAQGFLAYVEGRADEAVERFREAIADDERWGEAWALLGETYRHLLPVDVVPDSSSMQAFERANQVDPTFQPPLIHLAEQALREGDLRAADRLLEGLRTAGADPRNVGYLGVMRACLGQDPADMDWDAALSLDTLAVLDGAKMLAAGGAQPACAEGGLRAVYESDAPLAFRWGALQGLQGVLVTTGRGEEAGELLDEAAGAGGMPSAPLFHILDAFVTPSSEGAADAFVAYVGELTGGSYGALADGSGRRIQPRTTWLSGIWLAHRGQAGPAGRAQESLAAYPAPESPLLAAALAGHRALLEGDADAARELFGAIPSRSPRLALGYDIGGGMPVERLMLACIQLADGDAREALTTARLIDHTQPMSFVPFVAASLAVRLRAARSLGDDELAALHARRLRDLGREDLLDQDVCSSFQGGGS